MVWFYNHEDELNQGHNFMVFKRSSCSKLFLYNLNPLFQEFFRIRPAVVND